MQSRVLQSFLAVAECRSITEAAKALNVSQPALTKSIKKLELELGVELFDRSPVGISLTQSGNLLLHHVKIMENEYRHAMSGLERLKTGRSGELRIGAGPVWLVSILPKIIEQFREQFPDVRISLVSGTSGALVSDLLRGDFDIVFSALDFPNRSDIEKFPLIEIQNAIIVSQSHPLAGQGKVSIDELHKYPWMVLKNDQVAIERLNAFFASRGLSPPKIAMETTSIHSLLQSIHAGSCIANVPEQMLGLATSAGLVRLETDGAFWETAAGYILRKSARSTLVMQEFVDVTKAQLAVEGTLITDPS